MKGMIDSLLARHWFMHTSHAAIGVGATTMVPSHQQPPAAIPRQRPVPAKQDRTFRVGLVVGTGASWDLAAERLAGHLLRDDGMEVGHAWDRVIFGSDEATDYDCLILLGWPAASQRLVKHIELFCRRGGSLVALRAMHPEIPGWPNFAEEVLGGRQLPGQKCRLLEVERSECAWHHPVLEGLETLIAEGEGYAGPRFSPDTTVLLKTVNDSQTRQQGQPVAWARRHAGGRVFCTTLGLNDDFREPGFLRLVSNAVRWAGLVRAL
jgi:hypothetical protein